MSKLNMYEKLIKFEKYKYKMYLMIKEKPMSIPDILEFVPLTRSSATNMIENFVFKGHMNYFMGVNPKTGKKVKIYKFTGIEYIKKTRKDFNNFFVRRGERKEIINEEKKPDWYNPHATVYKLLDKPREPAPKSKPRSAYKGISSSFSMYEGI